MLFVQCACSLANTNASQSRVSPHWISNVKYECTWMYKWPTTISMAIRHTLTLGSLGFRGNSAKHHCLGSALLYWYVTVCKPQPSVIILDLLILSISISSRLICCSIRFPGCSQRLPEDLTHRKMVVKYKDSCSLRSYWCVDTHARMYACTHKRTPTDRHTSIGDIVVSFGLNPLI